MSSRLFWIHEDALSLTHPALSSRTEDDAVCFVWDDQHLQEMGYGFQRLVFIYETLCEMGIEVYRGNTADVLVEQARIIGADEVVVPSTVNPALLTTIKSIDPSLKVTVVESLPFVKSDGEPNLRRFFSYWKWARSDLMGS